MEYLFCSLPPRPVRSRGIKSDIESIHMMKILQFYAAVVIALSRLTIMTSAADAPAKPSTEEADKLCPITWQEDRKNSLYEKLGGKAALEAAVDSFYVKVLADERIKHFFDDINMKRQIRKQKEFLAAAFGGPVPWTGKDLRKAHSNIPGLNETHFNAVAENLQKTLEELHVKKELIDQVMAIAGSVKDQVLNKPVAKN